MRLDVFLKISRLIPRRSLAQEFCDAGLVKVNDASAKSSKEVKAGDEIEIKRRNRLTRITVLQVPDKKQMSKTDSENLYDVVSDEMLADDERIL
ncbi:MAG: RNA-binding S4 domain-containing protein [Saprospiraceae bacterium]|nr:RNA-binding S4 domain-containing protein [Pyrinomonadaceae bacterium]